MSDHRTRPRGVKAAGRGRFAGLDQPARGAAFDEAPALFVLGVACTLFRDDAAAATIEHGRHLLPWMGDTSFAVDRYDAVLLLEEIPQRPAGRAPQQRAADAELDDERYRDLDYAREHELENPLAYSLAASGHGACARAT